MKCKLSLVAACFVVIVISGWYMAEPWTVTFMDDGPYFSTDFVALIYNVAALNPGSIRL